MDFFTQDIYAAETSETVGTPSAAGENTAPQPDFWASGLQTMLFIFLLLVVMWFLLLRPQQKEQTRRQAMWDSLRKLDKIVTVGGIHGVVTDIDRDKGTLTLRIDEDKNVKVTIWINCVGQVLSDE